MKRYLAVAAILCTHTASANPLVASNPRECELFADVAIVARAMVVQRVPLVHQLPVLHDIYGPEGSAAEEKIERILGMALRAKKPAGEWATAFRAHCLERRGNMDGFEPGIRM